MCQEYGPGPGGETIEERRLREARELEERERRLREIEERRNRKVTIYTPVRMSSCHHIHFVFQPDEDDSFRHHMLKIKSTMEIAPEKAYCV